MTNANEDSTTGSKVVSDLPVCFYTGTEIRQAQYDRVLSVSDLWGESP
jgi:hypothetical protein